MIKGTSVPFILSTTYLQMYNNDMKNCIDCQKQIKSSSRCSKCWSRKWRAENPERYRKLRTKHYQEKREENIKKSAEWNKANKDKAKESHKRYIEKSNYYSNRYKTDLNFKLKVILRNRLVFALKTKAKTGSAVKDLGCSIDEFKVYIESKFQPGMNWDNYGKWEIDHIVPLSSFNLENREEFVKACNHTNLQPLWKIDNITKSDKIGL